MKSKVKNYLLFSLVTIGALSLLSSSTTISTNEVGTYQITYSQAGLYRLDTRTGNIVEIKRSNLAKIDINQK